ncbi:hypothetical protein Snov_1639 [Ancylobacter novellus DSM 506]|uniref:Uncharacterized protein n=1 Tax=Ancylobacter novellus (strain ATCC 8093 / DSM 506 / JCM 20403 / CCM 1077 / IAM 12100 / NBRC 12443 / NCIMB 10456) TaxID=639283 RepID=D7AAE1_ANCN5|nr:hypothetical protein [Ancylobacter novellus]ADH88944.1 hypothetical protein Snov_1639 [Ancylobacter novellus DSM 506]
MKTVLAAILAGALAGLYAVPASAQTPTYHYLGLTKAAAPPVASSTGHVGWTNVCRERSVVRRDALGRTVYLQVPMCNMVWIGRRYFHNGNYYADPTFATLLY